MENLIKYGLFAYLILNFGLTFVLPSYRVWKRTGIFPVTFSDKDTAHEDYKTYCSQTKRWI